MKEQKAWAVNGFLALILVLAFFVSGTLLLLKLNLWGILPLVLGFILLTGIKVVQPNKAFVVVFFGSYIGTLREPGMWLTVPFSTRKGVSLRVRNFNSKTLKVNDVEGNPIEIAAWMY